MALFPERWSMDGVDWKKKRKKKKHAIEHDVWDERDRKRMLKKVPPLPAAREKLGDFIDSGAPAVDDSFWALLKAEPEVEDPDSMELDHLKNHVVASQMLDLDEAHRLRRYSVNDDVQAALSAAALEPDLEILFDKLDQDIKDAAEQFEQLTQELSDLQGEASDVQEMIDGMTPGDGDGDGEGEGQDDELSPEEQEKLDAAQQKLMDLADQIREKQQEAQQAQQNLENSMQKSSGSVRKGLSEALDKAADEAQDMQNAAQAWGLDPAELQRLPADERMRLAEKFLSDSRIREIAKLFGPMKNMMLSEQKRKTNYVPEEVFDVGIGSEVDRLLPEELLLLDDDDFELDWLRRFAEERLLQYEMKGNEKLAQGGIIFCEDNSGSMTGQRERWAKAVCLCLLHLARQQKRTMHVIHFGSPGQFHTFSFTKPEHFTPDRIIEVAEYFQGGGTDFETPMQEALRILRAEHAETGGVDADVVFCTDDECRVQPGFMQEWLDEMERMQTTTWGISVAGSRMQGGALDEMTDGKVATIADFLSGRDVRHIFRSA